MESSDLGYRGYRCREGLFIALFMARPGGSLLPGFTHPCSRAGNTPHKIEKKEVD